MIAFLVLPSAALGKAGISAPAPWRRRRGCPGRAVRLGAAGSPARVLHTLPHRGKAARPAQPRARPAAAPRGATGPDGTAPAPVTGALAATLAALTAQVQALEAEIAARLAAHPDARIVTCLPRAGTVRAARLLAETGDCRARFPDPQSLAGPAGVAPVTRGSGTHISTGFRRAVNRQLRDAACDGAGDSRHASP